MKKTCLALVPATIFLQIAFCDRAEAQDSDPALESAATFIGTDDAFGLMEFARLSIYDEVEGNCWTNINSIRSKVELLLIQNDIEPLDYDPWSYNIAAPQLIVSVLGMRLADGTCVASGEVAVRHTVISEYGDRRESNSEEFAVFVYAAPFERQWIVTNGGNLNSQIEDYVESGVSELIKNVLIARKDEVVGRFLNQMTHFLEPPMSREEFQKMVNPATNGN